MEAAALLLRPMWRRESDESHGARWAEGSMASLFVVLMRGGTLNHYGAERVGRYIENGASRRLNIC